MTADETTSLHLSFRWLRCPLSSLSRTSHPSGSRPRRHELSGPWPMSGLRKPLVLGCVQTRGSQIHWLPCGPNLLLAQARGSSGLSAKAAKEKKRAGGCPIRSCGFTNPNSSSSRPPNLGRAAYANALSISNGTLSRITSWHARANLWATALIATTPCVFAFLD